MSIVKFKQNRVRRNYSGGKELDELQNFSPATDSDRPEEWVASLVEATNEGLTQIDNEGISTTIDGQKFTDLIQKNPVEMLGEMHYKQYGVSLAFLMKLLDSSMRLHTQVHPTRAFAKEKLNSDWGKFETYYVLKIRENAEGYIRLGFQKAPTKEEWKTIIEEQDIEKMNQCFEKIPIRQGDVVYIPGGIPHAIGEGVLLVEIMEPSDLVVRCEFEREGIVLPEESRFMGKGLDFCLDVFDYTECSVEEIQNNYFLEKELVQKMDDSAVYKLIPASISRTFEVYSYIIMSESYFDLDERFMVGLNLEGAVKLSSGDDSVIVQKGESFFIPAHLDSMTIEPINQQPAELCIVTNVLSDSNIER